MEQFNFNVDRGWLADCKSEEEKAIRKRELLDAQDLFLVLDSLLDQMVNQELDSLCKTEAYDTPSWAEKTADTLGHVRALKKVQRLLTLKPISKRNK